MRYVKSSQLGWPLLLLLGMLLMTGCITTQTTAPVSEIVAEICDKAWKPVSYDSKNDTQTTIDGNRASNRARAAFCKGE